MEIINISTTNLKQMKLNQIDNKARRYQKIYRTKTLEVYKENKHKIKDETESYDVLEFLMME